MLPHICFCSEIPLTNHSLYCVTCSLLIIPNSCPSLYQRSGNWFPLGDIQLADFYEHFICIETTLSSLFFINKIM